MRIESLTSLRFFAALLVLVSHLRFLTDSDSSMVKLVYDKLLWEGYIGVTFFFILSGFILCHAYEARLRIGQIGFWQYFTARIARIYPLHLLTLVLAIPLVTLLLPGSTESFWTFLANGLLIQSYFPERNIHFTANIPSWSLSDEMFFYVLFPLLIKVPMRLLWLLIAGLIGWQVMIGLSEFSEQRKHFYNYVFPLARLLDFCVGIVLYRWFRRPEQSLGRWAGSLLQLLALVSLAVFFLAKGIIPQAYRYDIYYIAPMAAVIYTFARFPGVLSEALGHRWLILLGEASFALYLTHHLVIRYTEVLADQLGFSLDAPAAAILLVMCVMVSVLCHLAVEKRLHKGALKLLTPLGRKWDGH